MLTYKSEQCQRCNGIGKVRFMFLFERDCPVCNGAGKIDVPQLTHEQDRKPFSVSALSPETLEAIKKKPELLSCLSPDNRVDLLRKHSELRQPRPIGYIGAVAEKQRRGNEEMMHAQQHQRQSEDFMRRGREQQDKFIKWSSQQHQHQFDDFMKWSHEQHQNWANEQFKNFVNQNRH